MAQTGTGTITFTVQNVRYQQTVNTSSTDITNWSLLASADIDAANIISGTVNPSRLGSGTANSDTFLNGNSSYQKVVKSVGIGSTQPFGIVASSSDFGVGFATHYGDIEITANRVATTLDTYSTTGVAKFKTSTFEIAEDGAVSIKNSSTGDVDASTLGGQTGAYYLNSSNHTGTIPINRGGTGQTGNPGDGAILIGNGSAYNLTTTPIFKGNVQVQATLTATTIVESSDLRLKENIKTIENALEKLSSLRGVEYNLKSNGQRKLGLIAQEVEKIIPEVVMENEDSMKSVAYGNIVGLLIECIKELRSEINELKNK